MLRFFMTMTWWSFGFFSILLNILLVLNQIFVFINSQTFSCFIFLRDLSSSPLLLFSLLMSFLIGPLGFLSELSYWNVYPSISIALSLPLNPVSLLLSYKPFLGLILKWCSFTLNFLKAPFWGARERPFIPSILSPFILCLLSYWGS